MNKCQQYLVLVLFLCFFILYSDFHWAFAREDKLNMYTVNLSEISKYDVLSQGTVIEAVLLEDITREDYMKKVNFKIPMGDEDGLLLKGFVIQAQPGGRFSEHGTVQFSTSEVVLESGNNIEINAISPSFEAYHSPHIDSNLVSIANTVTNLSLTASPVTLGISIGASFLVNGILSAKQNGISDFIWGGLNGSGLSIVEKLLRKQPDGYIAKGEIVPFILKEDLKVSRGYLKEELTETSVDNSYAKQRIKQLIEWGDLAGALEFSIRAGQEKIYEEIISKIAM